MCRRAVEAPLANRLRERVLHDVFREIEPGDAEKARRGRHETPGLLAEEMRKERIEGFAAHGIDRLADAAPSFQSPGRAMLTAERSALNTVQHLSGVATLTREYVVKRLTRAQKEALVAEATR